MRHGEYMRERKGHHSVQQQQQHENEEHCVIHIHGLHHSGTGFLRKTVYGSLGKEYASIHENTGKSEDEGQHLQNVYPPFSSRRSVCRDDDNRTFIGRLYYCPEILEIAKQENASESLFQQWSLYWNMTKPFLIQKTPTMDVLLLEHLKTHNTVHVIVMRHPFVWTPPKHITEQVANPGLFFLTQWLNVWAHVLEQLSKEQVYSFAVVQYETLVERSDELSQELSDLIQKDCAIDLHHATTPENRRLHLHKAQSSKYLIPTNGTLTRWNLCEQSIECLELMDQLVPIISQLGYSWDKDAYFNETDGSGFLFTATKLPPRKMVERMKELDEKYSFGI